MPEHSDSHGHDGADVPEFVTDDWLASRLRRLEREALEVGAAAIGRELAKLAELLERDIGQVPAAHNQERGRTVADLTASELLAIFPGSTIEHHTPFDRA